MQRLIVVLLAVAVTIILAMVRRPVRVISPRAEFFPITSSRGYFQISGNFRHPGIYPITVNSVTHAANIVTLGGPLVTSPNDQGNARSGVTNGDVFTIRFEGEVRRVEQGTMAVIERIVMGIPLDISSIKDSEFGMLPGFGPSVARQIIQFRQKNGGQMRVEQLREVEGIGEKKYTAIRSLFIGPEL